MMTMRPIGPAWLALGASVWMATAANTPLWRELSSLGVLDQPMGWAFAAAMASIIAFGLMALLSVLSWRWILKPALAFLLIAAAAGSYFMGRYNIVVDSTMVTNALQTDAHEASALLSPMLFLVVFAMGVVPAALICRWPVRYGGSLRRTGGNLLALVLSVVLLAAVVLASFQPLSSTMRNHKQVRYLMNPLNTVYALGALAAEPFRRDERRLEPIGLDARLAAAAPGARPPMLLLVLGETGRSGNFGLNGYARDTTPRLAQAGVASFRNAWSCGTSTAASVPCMFSALGREAFEARSHNYEGLMDVLQRAGLAVLWLDNQSGCKGVCDRVPHVNTSSGTDPQLCPGGECLDGVMLEGLDARLAALPAERRARGVVIVMHQMGSHGPAYSLRSPAASKRFLPECTGNDLQKCARQELVNAYDNSIAYTDEFLAGGIGWLKRQESAYDPALLYVADHGESLGENNLYLHGLPYAIAPDVQKHVPWITWLAPGFEQRSSVAMDCLRGQADARITHDSYFHSVLGLLGVQTSAYRRELDAYAPCARMLQAANVSRP